MTPREKYEKAKRRREVIFRRIKGGMTESTQAKLDAATDEMIKARRKLVEIGEWEGPIPIELKKKYRRR